ncbi:RNA polymerase sigma-70 factor, ECF subfamily [Cnuella takakiae]|uniref:RNA polymerase sigma-70 factor, ECF subfamily n=1 Tax=Cnuella takakiae TaxID=1302690 RepID=A0A1M4YFN9_9BACT|nr:RNA polymerase sigma-70 factor [Cnuella takakiae]OLY94878.1 hypothetical protein BUE76_15500 [Cnuella takakiae]SHF04540.1 RNA polymerase sigma-70 factor, ECF subfamily [Cnuella takakiae]
MNELDRIADLQHRIAILEDMRAYQELYHLLFDRLYRFSFSFVKSREAAEEIVSDVFIKLWQIRSDLKKVVALKVYLYTITRNFSINYITRHYKHQVVSLDGMEDLFVASASPEELAISAEMYQKVQAAIRDLPPQCRAIFQLVREDGLKYKDVAAIMDVSVLTVRNQVAIATKKLAAALPATLGKRIADSARFSHS